MQAVRMNLEGVAGSFVVLTAERDDKSVTLTAQQALALLNLLLGHSQELLQQLESTTSAQKQIVEKTTEDV